MRDWIFSCLIIIAGGILVSSPLYPQSIVHLAGNVASGGSPPYDPFSAAFAGTNDYLSFTGVPTGFADTKLGTISIWIDFTGGDGSQQYIIWNLGTRFNVKKNADNTLGVVAKDQFGTTIVDLTSSITKTASDGWFHLLIVLDTASSANTKMYFDGVEDTSLTETTLTDANIDWTRQDWYIAADSALSNDMTAQLGEFWIDDLYNDVPGDYISGGSPVDLGTDGSTPTGAAPEIYLSRNGDGASWVVDSSGNGNTFTANGDGITNGDL